MGRSHNQPPLLFILLFAVAFSIVATTLDYSYIRDLRESLATLNYVPVMAEVTNATVEQNGQGRNAGLVARIDYSFEVQGRAYQGTGTTSHETAFKSRPRAEQSMNRHPAGSQLLVYYDPADPGRNSRTRGLQRFAGMGLLILLPFHVIAIGCWGFFFHLLRTEPSDSPIATTSSSVPIILKSNYQWAAALVAAGCLPIVALLAGTLVLDVILNDTGNALPWYSCVAFVSIMVFTAVVFVAFNMHQPWLPTRVIVEGATRQLKLNAASTRGQWLTLQFSDIRRIEVRQIGTHYQRKWTAVRFCPVLVTIADNDGRREIALAQCSSEQKAHHIVDWLKRHLQEGGGTLLATDAQRWALLKQLQIQPVHHLVVVVAGRGLGVAGCPPCGRRSMNTSLRNRCTARLPDRTRRGAWGCRTNTGRE